MEPITLFEKREALKRVLQSKHFARSRRKNRFLEFVCEQSFAGNADKLNEYLIGVEIYDRGSGFDPQQDAIVRVQAHEIRKSLKRYYEVQGQDDVIVIDLPLGHYVPVFSRAANYAPPRTPGSVPVTSSERAGALRPRQAMGGKAVVVLLALSSVAFAFLFVRERYFVDRRPAVTATALTESVAWFWKPFLPPAEAPLIVLPNHPLLRAAHDGDSAATLAQSQLIPKEILTDFRDTVHFRELAGFYFVPSTTDFTAVGEALGLLDLFELFREAGLSMQVKASRLVDFETVKRGNTILLGGNQSWSGRIFLYPDGFQFHKGVITNKTPRPGEQAVYKPEFDPITNALRRDYALVLMLANEKREHRILLIYGIYTQGSQAAIQYLTSEERLQELKAALIQLSPDRETPPQFFQVLLQTTVENYVPGKVSFVSARIIPDDLASGVNP